MRTNSSQFQLLVEFMERNGDLSKPTEGPHGRATNLQRWEELSEILNADATGDTKNAEKWRKVWSDFKNNTKKKASRLYRAAQGTGGGPPSNLKLSDLEQRVLSLVGTQAATGIVEIPEVGLDNEETETPSLTALDLTNIQTQDQKTYSSLHAMDSTPPAARSAMPSNARSRVLLSPTPLSYMPRRRRRGQAQSSPIRRRTRTQTQSELAREAFIRSDSEWRASQQEAERERNRLRERELDMQQQWIELFGQFVALGNRFANIYEKK